jgi:hypothetical protein
MARRPKPLHYTSSTRPHCGPVRWGQAVPLRERAMMLQLHLAGHSYAAISRMTLVGRHPKTISAIVKRALQAGTLLPRPTGGRGNCPPRLGPAARLYLRVRPLSACVQHPAADNDAAQTLIKFRPKLYLCEIAQRLQHDLGVTVSETTLCGTLAGLRLSRKKLARIVAQKSNPANLARYMVFEQAQRSINMNAVVWLDETGLCDLDADRTHGRCAAAAPPARRCAALTRAARVAGATPASR